MVAEGKAEDRELRRPRSKSVMMKSGVKSRRPARTPKMMIRRALLVLVININLKYPHAVESHAVESHAVESYSVESGPT